MKSVRLSPRDRLGVIGKTGQGKSHWIKQLLLELVREGAPIVAFDPLDELSVLGLLTDEVTLGPLKRRATVAEIEADSTLLDDTLEEPLCLAVVPVGESQKEIAEEFETFARLVKLTGNLVMVVEETGVFGEHCYSMLNLVATTYRHFGIAVVMSAQRMTQIPKTARAQLSEVIAFRTDDEDDLEQLSKVVKEPRHAPPPKKGEPPTPPTFAERVSRLTPGQFEHWRDNNGEAQPAQKHRRKAR